MTATTDFRAIATSSSAPLRFRERAKARLGLADVLVFRVGTERFAVDLQAVEETLESIDVHSVPESSPSVIGVFAHGDQFIPLYDAAVVLGMMAPVDSCTAALVMRGGGRRIGLAVADVEDVVALELSTLRNIPERVWNDELLLGLVMVSGLLIGLLDARALLSACQTAPIPEAL
ncbi:MAG: chemotaxis protein CheW [Gemmatimonadaceae bacterium]